MFISGVKSYLICRMKSRFWALPVTKQSLLSATNSHKLDVLKHINASKIPILFIPLVMIL